MKKAPTDHLLVNRINAFYKLIISLFLAAVCYFVIPFGDIEQSYHLISSWDIFCLCLLILNWITFFYNFPKRHSQSGKQTG